MRALTLTQPWAGLVASGIKLVENRPRRMIKAEDFGKPFAIHASREIDEDIYQRIADIAPDLWRHSFNDEVPVTELGTIERWYQLSRITSAVIAVATLERIVDPLACGLYADSDDARAALAPDQRRWFFGPIGYVLRDVVALRDPVPCRGWQGFWTLADDVERQVIAQLGERAA